MSAYTDTLNRRQRMTQAKRDEAIVREIFGPLLARVFPDMPTPQDIPTPRPDDEIIPGRNDLEELNQ